MKLLELIQHKLQYRKTRNKTQQAKITAKSICINISYNTNKIKPVSTHYKSKRNFPVRKGNLTPKQSILALAQYSFESFIFLL